MAAKGNGDAKLYRQPERFVALEPCDLRKNFNGLHALVSERLQEEVLQGTLFVSFNWSHTRLKMVYWDGTGLWLLIKPLEKGTFSWPKPSQSGAVNLRLAPDALALLTHGVDLRGAKLRPYYEREQKSQKLELKR